MVSAMNLNINAFGTAFHVHGLGLSKEVKARRIWSSGFEAVECELQHQL